VGASLHCITTGNVWKCWSCETIRSADVEVVVKAGSLVVTDTGSG